MIYTRLYFRKQQKFLDLLKDIKPTKEILDLTLAISQDVWSEEMKNLEKEKVISEQVISEKRNEIQILSKLVSKSESEYVVKEYEKQIEKLAKEISELEVFLDVDIDTEQAYQTSWNMRIRQS